ncbi:hypothetical protein BC834DRAFT_973870 [Gloeopeniophorella convolvens]|nr:hypothetical protein BC834DRAFT_973870 [Gloeopeniophorella convolvens]
MGASQSKHDDEQVFYNPVPIQVSAELVGQLSDPSASPDVSPARHAALDDDVRAKIAAELARLHEGDDAVRREIEAALERENLDRERGLAGDADAAAPGGVKNSEVLLGDLEEVRQKVDRYRARAELADHPEIKRAGEAVAACYRGNASRTLDCWAEVADFRSAVAKLEQEYVESLR